ncbi:MAG TPA: hypothetical protein ENI82_02115 [Bacteroidetes bacterium]|nr:hypothetical protein [Bacteroidota bacterium]
MKKLPIGIQTFSDIIKEGFVYVDKTEIAYKLINNGRYYFLSRPRRFGKSLFLDTLKEIFEGNKEIFKGLYIYDRWDWKVKYPVLRISLGSGVHKTVKDLSENLLWILKKTERDLGIKCKDNLKPKQCFEHLLVSAYEKYNQKVVVLIDEYDKPILDNITDKEVAREMRDAMKDFYGVIKDNDAFIQFVFITGVSKFSKMNLFSGLNNLNDITLDEKYATICGYTHNDLLTVFEEHLRGVDMEKVKKWYNGYNYLGDKVYNPFDILLFIDKNFEYSNYWWETGNPSFLIEMLKTQNYYIPELENFVASKEILNTFDVDKIELVALLWQTGYLTITKKTSTLFGIKYTLNTPNREIQTSLNSLFITYLTGQVTEKLKYQEKLFDMLDKPDLDGFRDALFTLFASISYTNFINSKLYEYEGYYASVVYAYLASIGLDIIPEDTTNLGRMDLSAKLEDKVFIFEFKLTEKATGNALKQIKEKRYWEKYQDFNDIYLIGIEFSREKRNIIGYEWTKL